MLLPSWLEEDYDQVFIAAQRFGTRGRASGGLTLLIRKPLNINILEIDSFFIFVEIKINQQDTIIFGCVYFHSEKEINSLFEELLLTCDYIFQMTDKPIIFGGDMNSHIGEEHVLDEDLVMDTTLSSRRLSNDKRITRRGEDLLRQMDALGMAVLNGRITGDIPAQFTYIDERKTSDGRLFESSVIDLVFCNTNAMPTTESLCVLEELHNSDHLPISCKLDIETMMTIKHNGKHKTILKWNEEKKAVYKELINRNLENPSRDIIILCETPNSTEHRSKFLKETIITIASDLQMMYRINSHSTSRKVTPWLNKACRDAKFQVRRSYRAWKRNKTHDKFERYVDNKKKYRNVKIASKREYEEDIKNKLSNIKNSTEFWKIIKKYKPKRKNNRTDITKEDWTIHFNSIYTAQPHVELTMSDAGQEMLTRDFLVIEIESALRNLKKGKAPGPDKVPNEFFKNMDNIDYIQNMFNTILQYEYLPEEWSQSEIVNIFKKGDRNDPSNYRPIALLNTLTKMFTQLLANRINEWADKNDVYPEEQAGFRKRRGCVDQIFILNTAIQLTLRRPKQKLYACFVDFKSCFDSLNHEIIWQKLFKAGIPTKLIRIIKSLYDQAVCRVRLENTGYDGTDRDGVEHAEYGEYTPWIRVTKGALQGDSLSPTLFILMVADIIRFMEDRGFTGINISQNKLLQMLLFADDLVILGTSRIDLQKKINALLEYCSLNLLNVNIEKTKVVVFRKGGKLSKFDKFFYDDKKLEVTKKYTYLGVVFSSSGLFREHMEYALSKAKIALANIKSIMVNARMETWESRMVLYNSILKVTLLYAAEIWALRYSEEIEKCQVQFFKSILCLPWNTPNHYIRLEVGVVKLYKDVLKMALRWHEKMTKSDDNRLTKMCFTKLESIQDNNLKYNWLNQMKHNLAKVNYNDEITPGEDISDKIEGILNLAQDSLFEEDVRKLNNSSYSEIYKHIKDKSVLQPEGYLLYKTPIDRTRVICQIRLQGKMASFYTEGKSFRWNTLEECDICNQKSIENLYHIFVACPHYENYRLQYLQNWINKYSENEIIYQVLNIKSNDHLNNLYYFLKSVLKKRQFLRDE